MPKRSNLADVQLPPTVWLDADAEPITATTAAGALREYEARLCLAFEIEADGLALLALAPAATLLWVAFKRSHAARRFRRPRELALNDAPAVILGADHQGGFLLWLTATEDEAMSIFDTLKARLTGESERFHILDQETQQPGAAMDAETAVRTFARQSGFFVETFDAGGPKIGLYTRPYPEQAAALAEGMENSFRDVAMNFVASGAFSRSFGPEPERPTDPTPPKDRLSEIHHVDEFGPVTRGEHADNLRELWGTLGTEAERAEFLAANRAEMFPNNDPDNDSNTPRGKTLFDLMHAGATMVDGKPTFEIPVERSEPTPEQPTSGKDRFADLLRRADENVTEQAARTEPTPSRGPNIA